MRWLPETQAKPDALCMPTDRVARRACDNDSPARRLNDSSSVRSSWRGAVGAILGVCRTLRIDEPMRLTERMDDRGIRSGERQVREVAPMALLAILRRDPVARSERAGCRPGPLELCPANGHLGASVLRVPVVWHRDSDSERGAQPTVRARPLLFAGARSGPLNARATQPGCTRSRSCAEPTWSSNPCSGRGRRRPCASSLSKNARSRSDATRRVARCCSPRPSTFHISRTALRPIYPSRAKASVRYRTSRWVFGDEGGQLRRPTA